MPPTNRKQKCPARNQAPRVNSEQLKRLRHAAMEYREGLYFCDKAAEKLTDEHPMKAFTFRTSVLSTLYELGERLREFSAIDSGCHMMAYELCPEAWNIFFSSGECDDRLVELQAVFRTINSQVLRLEDFIAEEEARHRDVGIPAGFNRDTRGEDLGKYRCEYLFIFLNRL
ncbi:hypothetical protein H072_8288 [Dactylellina haptotyla CBS 200.50]|uniref:Uncharacterized protein n=1 Tax=Dactylellina haptotyla (strain CBS 200.50) TaxID=1284197 RepID=S8BS01_DACHA|nr:hypothetical protein H072_8288 [Dactylellina haptotyla CBS 200.50]